MENQDRQAIEGLFSRLGEVERQAGARDAQAEGFIRERISQQPGAPYFMAQTIVMQDYALQQAQARIQQLEQEQQEAEERPAAGGGFLSGMFGGGQSAPRRASSVPTAGRSPMGRPVPMGAPQMGGPAGGMQMAPGAMAQPGRGGGFLAGAAQTAMGVAGGVLLGNALGGMFGGGEAKAAEPAAAEPAPAQQPQEPAAAEEEGGFFDGWFGGDEEN
jgi:hypothetical protein